MKTENYHLKKANVVPVRKLSIKQTLENYRSVPLFPICGKVFERLNYSSLFEFLIEDELISFNNLALNKVILQINQLLCITREIYKLFDDGHEFRDIFLDTGP